MHDSAGAVEPPGSPIPDHPPERFASAILDASLDAVVVIDADGHIRRTNPAAETLFGYPPGGLVGREVTDLMPPDYVAAHREGMARHLESGGGAVVGGRHDLEGLTRAGERFPLRLSVAELTENGQRYFVGILHDLSSVRAAQAEREQRLRQLRCLQALAAHMRRQPPIDEMLARIGETLPQGLREPEGVRVRVRVEDREWCARPWPEGGESLEETVAVEGQPRGELVVCAATKASPAFDDEERETVRTVATMLGDMVGRRHKARELERYVQELESFSYAVSHDLRAPLRALDGFSQALDAKYPEALDERGRDYLRRIRNASQRMSHLIDALLRLSRISRQPMKWAPVDLSGLAHEAMQDLRDAEPARAVAFHCAPQLRVWGDAALLRIVLQNLLGNAWKFTADTDGPVIELGRDPVDPGWFYVRDNGAGFDPRYSDRLFGAFQRLHSESEFEGTGIGLVTVKRIVRRHGGDVSAEGEPGRGATFWFELRPAEAGRGDDDGEG